MADAFSIALYIGICTIFPLLLTKSFNIKDTVVRRIFTVVLISVSSLIYGLRETTGTDSASYINFYYNHIYGIQRWVEIEKGYTIINNFASSLMPYWFFMFLISFVSTSLIVVSIRRYKGFIDVYLAFLIYYSTLYLTSFNIVRQALATGLCIYAICLYLDNKKILVSLTIIIVAVTIHTSALICLVIFFSGYLFEKRKSNVFFLLALMATMYLVINRNVFGNIVGRILDNQYYAGYFMRDSFTGGTFLRYFIKISPIIIISSLYYQSYLEKKGMRTLYVYMILGYILSALGAILDTQVGRIGSYFTALSMFVLSYCVNNDLEIRTLKLKIGKSIPKVIIFSYFLGNLLYNLYMNYGQIVPYVPLQNLG